MACGPIGRTGPGGQLTEAHTGLLTRREPTSRGHGRPAPRACMEAEGAAREPDHRPSVTGQNKGAKDSSPRASPKGPLAPDGTYVHTLCSPPTQSSGPGPSPGGHAGGPKPSEAGGREALSVSPGRALPPGGEPAWTRVWSSSGPGSSAAASPGQPRSWEVPASQERLDAFLCLPGQGQTGDPGLGPRAGQRCRLLARVDPGAVG